MAHRVTLIPGDGIGPEVADAARRVVEATGVEINWDVQEAGAAVTRTGGTPLPDRVLRSIETTRTALKGPITTPVGTGFRSVNVALRQELDLFAAVRPAQSLPGIPSRYADVDLVVIRENTEDLYAGIEFMVASNQLARLRELVRDLLGIELPWDAGATVKPICLTGTRRIVRFAFDFARRNGREKVTVGHKANIMRYSDGLFLFTAAAESASYLDIEFEECQVDELAYRLVVEPATWEVRRPPRRWPRPSPGPPAQPWQPSRTSLAGRLPTGSLLHLSTPWLAGVAAAALQPGHRKEAIASRQPHLGAERPAILAPVREELRRIVPRSLMVLVVLVMVRHGSGELTRGPALILVTGLRRARPARGGPRSSSPGRLPA